MAFTIIQKSNDQTFLHNLIKYDQEYEFFDKCFPLKNPYSLKGNSVLHIHVYFDFTLVIILSIVGHNDYMYASNVSNQLPVILVKQYKVTVLYNEMFCI